MCEWNNIGKVQSLGGISAEEIEQQLINANSLFISKQTIFVANKFEQSNCDFSKFFRKLINNIKIEN